MYTIFKVFLLTNSKGNTFESSVKIDEIYDLKGSTKGRTSKGFVKKDLDLQKKLLFGKEEKKKFIEQIERDSEVWIWSMDFYSFLAFCKLENHWL